VAKGRRDNFDGEAMQKQRGIELVDFSDYPDRKCNGKWKGKNGEDIFFLGSGGRSTAAKNLCLKCVIVEECAEYGVFYPEDHGVLGGTMPADRKEIRHYLVDGIPWEVLKAAVASAQADKFPDKHQAKDKGTKTLSQHVNEAVEAYNSDGEAAQTA
jgi:hypothetical protein